MAKFGGTSKTDAGVASGTTSTIIVEEKVTIAASIPSPVMLTPQGVFATHAQSTPMLSASVARETPLNPVTPEVYTSEKSFASESADRLAKLLAEEAEKSKGTIRPKIEIVGEACESCSA